MATILMIVCSAIMILLHYQVVTLCFLVLVCYHAIKSDVRTLLHNFIAFSISMFILLGIPVGITKAIYKDEIAGTDMQNELIKEVASWVR